MVTTPPVFSLGRNGLQDWLLQRITAILLAAYVAFLLGYFILHPNLRYEEWQALFYSPAMGYSSLVALLSLVAHAWVGIWTVITDYIKPTFVRLMTHLIVIAALIGYLVWGVQIIRGI